MLVLRCFKGPWPIEWWNMVNHGQMPGGRTRQVLSWSTSCYISIVWCAKINQFMTGFAQKWFSPNLLVDHHPTWLLPSIGGFLKYGHPSQSSIFMGFLIINNKPYILGYPHCGKPPIRSFYWQSRAREGIVRSGDRDISSFLRHGRQSTSPAITALNACRDGGAMVIAPFGMTQKSSGQCPKSAIYWSENESRFISYVYFYIIYLSIYLSIYMSMSMSMSMSMPMCMYMHVCVCECMYVRMYVYIYIYCKFSNMSFILCISMLATRHLHLHPPATRRIPQLGGKGEDNIGSETG